MFSVNRLSAKCVFSPKNGPVPNQGVNGYILPIDRRGKIPDGLAGKKQKNMLKGPLKWGKKPFVLPKSG